MVTDSILISKDASALDLNNPNIHFTMLFEVVTSISLFNTIIRRL